MARRRSRRRRPTTGWFGRSSAGPRPQAMRFTSVCPRGRKAGGLETDRQPPTLDSHRFDRRPRRSPASDGIVSTVVARVARTRLSGGPDAGGLRVTAKMPR